MHVDCPNDKEQSKVKQQLHWANKEWQQPVPAHLKNTAHPRS
jgi:hypothetical protein